jgi:hypothetical protein
VRTDNALSAEELLDQTANADLTATYRWSGGSSVNLTAGQQENLRTGVKTRELPGVSFQSMGQIFPADDPDDTAWYRDLRYSYNARFSSYNDKMADSIFKYQDSLYNARLNDSAPLARSRPLELPYQGAGQTLALTATHKVGHVDFTATGNLRHDWTSYSYDAPSSAFTAGAWHPYSTQWQPDQILTWNAGMNARTRFYGMWMPYWGRFAGLRHTVNPAVGYTFTPHIDPRPYFVANPKLGQATGQKKASQVTLSLGQILDGKILSDSATDTAKAKSKKGTSYSLLSLTTTTNYHELQHRTSASHPAQRRPGAYAVQSLHGRLGDRGSSHAQALVRVLPEGRSRLGLAHRRIAFDPGQRRDEAVVVVHGLFLFHHLRSGVKKRLSPDPHPDVEF